MHSPWKLIFVLSSGAMAVFASAPANAPEHRETTTDGGATSEAAILIRCVKNSILSLSVVGLTTYIRRPTSHRTSDNMDVRLFSNPPCSRGNALP